MTLPNFIICGIQKGGTTSLYQYLREHPEVFMSETKEVNYFSLHFDESPGWYAGHFADASGQTAIGEASPNYMWRPDVARLIHELIPDAKLIFVLRDPVDRAYSNFWFNISRGAWDPSESFSEAIKTEDGARRLIEKGFYHRHLERFLEYFSPDQMFVILNDELRSRPVDAMKECHRFLGVSEDFMANTERRYNATEMPRNGLATLALKVAPTLRGLVRTIMSPRLRAMADRPRARLRSLLFEARRPEPIPSADRAYLEGIYRDDVLALAEHFQLELSQWSTYQAAAIAQSRDGAASPRFPR
jgi:hypothetical protein